MNKFIKNNVGQIIGLIVSLFSLGYIYIFESIFYAMYHTQPNFWVFMAGGLFIISGLLFFSVHCTPVLVITAKEKLCKVPAKAKIVTYTSKGIKLMVDDVILILPRKLKEKEHPEGSELDIFVDKDLETVYYPVKNDIIMHIIGMIVSMLYIIISIFILISMVGAIL